MIVVETSVTILVISLVTVTSTKFCSRLLSESVKVTLLGAAVVTQPLSLPFSSDDGYAPSVQVNSAPDASHLQSSWPKAFL